jgi:hypothetical protein
MSEEPLEPKPSKLKLSSSRSSASEQSPAARTSLEQATQKVSNLANEPEKVRLKLTKPPSEAQPTKATQAEPQQAAQPERVPLKLTKPQPDAQTPKITQSAVEHANQPSKLSLKTAKPRVEAQPTPVVRSDQASESQPPKLGLKATKPRIETQPTPDAQNDQPSESQPPKVGLKATKPRIETQPTPDAQNDQPSESHAPKLGLKAAKPPVEAQPTPVAKSDAPNKSQPPKLGLKAAKPPVEAQPTPVAQNDAANKSQPPKVGLKAAKPPVETQPTPDAQNDAANKSQPPKVGLKAAKPRAEAQPEQDAQSDEDTTRAPQQDSTTPERVNQQPSPIDTPKTEALDSTIQQIPEANQRNNQLISILIIGLLFLILSAAAAGIWYLLKDNAETLNVAQPEAQLKPTAETAQQETAEVETTGHEGPISKTKAVIEQVSVTEFDEIRGATQTDASTIPEPRASPPIPTATTIDSSKAQAITVPATEVIARPKPPSAPAIDPTTIQVNEQLKQAASQYLQNVHIGALRTGPRARVMLNGVNYAINDEVDSATGLRFLGTREQRLVFKDRNGTVYVKSF